MSMTPTAGRATAKSAGLWFATAPTRSPAVRSAADGELLGPGVALIDEKLGGGNEVVEDVLLVRERPAVVPWFAILSAAAEIRLRVHTSELEPNEIAHRESWSAG